MYKAHMESMEQTSIQNLDNALDQLSAFLNSTDIYDDVKVDTELKCVAVGIIKAIALKHPSFKVSQRSSNGRHQCGK